VLHGIDECAKAIGKWRLSEIGHVYRGAALRRGGVGGSNPFYIGHFSAVLRAMSRLWRGGPFFTAFPPDYIVFSINNTL
jgi:hypothetical protein